MSWKKISKSRKLKEKNDYVVIVPCEEKSKSIPWMCPVCNMLMRHRNDAAYYRKYKACYDCSLTWAESRATVWSEGWRPEQTSVDKRVAERKSVPIRIDINIY